VILGGSSKVGKAKVYKTRKEMRLTKELTQERERRESAERALMKWSANQPMTFSELIREHFKKYDSHQSEG